MNTLSDTREPLKMENRRKTVFLDRDGVINRKMPEGEYVSSWEQFEFLPEVPEAIAALNRNGFRVLVVTNQRGVSLGLYTRADVEYIHEQLQRQLATAGAWVDNFYICPHGKNECNCRKPGPGLFEQALVDFPDIDPAQSLVIGDSLSDIEFGRNLGIRTMFVRGKSEYQKPGASTAALLADCTVSALPEAVSRILNPAE
jgi:D-glycero-D-manno-heptose 1,7-bisphosphate phosphatase